VQTEPREHTHGRWCPTRCPTWNTKRCALCKVPQPRSNFSRRHEAYCNTCKPIYRSMQNAKLPRKHYAKTLTEYFNKRVVRREPDACWEWQGWRDDNGYGKGSFQGQEFRAHRLSYELHTGPLLTTDIVMHTCDNPPCVNPHHLKKGTKRDNMLDARSKGRHKLRLRKIAAIPKLIRPHPSSITPPTLQDYFWKHVRTLPDDVCWEWQGSRLKRGYGTGAYKKRRVLAHKLAYELFISDIPAGMLVRHTCDNPPCCNPRHLILGSSRDNIHDSLRRGRRGHLTPLQVAEIRTLRAAGQSLRTIARTLTLPYSTVHYAARADTWEALS
jgi:HNH endonuclease